MEDKLQFAEAIISPEIICQKIPEHLVVIAYKLLLKYGTWTLYMMGG